MNSNLIHEFTSRIFVINGTVLLLFAVLISVSNGLLLFALYKDPLKTFRNATAVLVAALGITDFLTGCVTAVDVGICHIIEATTNRKVMLQAKIISQVTVRASVFIMILFAVERFMAVAFPYFYRFSITIRKTLFGCVLCWVFAIVTSCLELTVDRDLYDMIFLYLTFVVPLLTLSFTYCASCWLMKQKAKRLKTHDARKEKSTKVQTQLTKTATLIILVFILSLLPFWSLTVVARYCKSCAKESWFIACYRFSIPILYSNSALNPVLYAWRMQSYRRTFVALFTGVRVRGPFGRHTQSCTEKPQRYDTLEKDTASKHEDETKL